MRQSGVQSALDPVKLGGTKMTAMTLSCGDVVYRAVGGATSVHGLEDWQVGGVFGGFFASRGGFAAYMDAAMAR